MELIPSAPSLTIADGLATVRLNRPGQHNRLEASDIDVLAGMLDRIATHPAIRALVLCADGASFCAGFDLGQLGRPAGEAGGLAGLAAMIDALERVRVPSICALNGPVYGGGTDLALACDFRVGVPTCRMFMPAARFGLHYYHSGMRRYVSRLGLGAAKRLFLLGETLDAMAMREIGFLDQIVPDPAMLDARVAEMAQSLLSVPSATVLESMKGALDRIASGDLDPAEADAAWAATRSSPAVAAAVAAARPGRQRP